MINSISNNEKFYKNNFASRRSRARQCAVQALYSWQLSNNRATDVEIQFLLNQSVADIDINYFYELYTGVINNSKELDGLMEPYLSRRLKRVDQVERAVLRIALFELNNCRDIPYKVAINEAIELTKLFGAEKSHKFINGVLNRIAFQMRSE
ncbi:transcription antitermination factor NusB [Sodalis sp. CWE]|uniref:transcription antitermination factor NusB n=1 Tax=Sodalis sp. CWE TaxID=2803816 RepID=UPI001C7D879D|nr:transcription antitermination factor NusB [Sodalis sp. CWE]MBX4181207.1 transcription antitermination factor NusB [Sodalis sp. CWE]